MLAGLEQPVSFIFLERKTMHRRSPSKSWRMQKLRYRLIGSQCQKCKNVFYPSREFCPSCQVESSMKKRILSPLGRILVFSFIHAAPEGLEQLGPYPIALVKLDDGPTILTQITDYDPSTLSEGQRV